MFRFLSAALRLLLILGLIAGATAVTATALSTQGTDLGDIVAIETTEISVRGLATRSKVYDRNGTEIARLKDAGSNREILPIEEIAPEVVQAVVAIEDGAFYDHVGINVQAIARAAVENVGAGGITQGGSTITQQIIKNLVLNDDQDLDRKIAEASLAVRLENQYTKDELLELYLNTVYFGAGAWGVKAAAEVYWGKEASDLNWGEAAMLAGLIRLPHTTNPITNPDVAKRQRSIVLGRLADLELIGRDDARFFSRTPLPTAPQSNVSLPDEDYFTDQVRQLVLGEAAPSIDPQFQKWVADNPGVLGATIEERIDVIFGSGLRIHTTLSPQAQAQAEAAQAAVLPDDPRGFTMAMISVDPATGAVPSMVGGLPYSDDNEYNIATGEAGRQPGSSFKTFVLVTALEAGYTPVDQFDGRGPCRFPNIYEEDGFYDVANFDGSQGSIASLQALTTSSSNCGYVGLGQVVGVDNVVDVARRLGVSGSIEATMSLPLGVEEVSPLDMASAYATIFNDGVRNDPYFIERIEDSRGEVLYQHRQASVRAIDSEVACWARDVLVANVQAGTGTAAQIVDQEAGGKTGTTEQSGDAWFVGSSPYLATAVWMGHPDGNTERMVNVGGRAQVTGGSFPAQAWGLFNNDFHETLDRREFDACPAFARGGRFVKGDGEFGSFLFCEGAVPFPVDVNADGVPDQCYPSTAGLFECGTDGGGFDQYGNPIQLYCLRGGASPGQTSGAPGGTSGQVPRQEQTLANGDVIRCPDSNPRGFDTDGDGIIDECRR